MKIARRLLLATLMGAAMSSAVHADAGEKTHEAKQNIKMAGKQFGHDVRDAAHDIGRTAKAAGHAVASGTRRGYDATKHAIRKAVGKDDNASASKSH